MLLNVATSLLKSGCGDGEALLESLGDTSWLRGSGRVLSELASRCSPDGGNPGAVVTAAMVATVEMFLRAADTRGVIDEDRRSKDGGETPRWVSPRSGGRG